MVAQLVEDLIHFKSGHDRLDQHGRANGALGQPKLTLSMHEDVVPQPRFEMAFDFRQVEIRSATPCYELLGVVEKEQPEIEQGAGHRLAVDEDVPFPGGANRAGGRTAPQSWRWAHSGGRFRDRRR